MTSDWLTPASASTHMRIARGLTRPHIEPVTISPSGLLRRHYSTLYADSNDERTNTLLPSSDCVSLPASRWSFLRGACTGRRKELKSVSCYPSYHWHALNAKWP